MTDTAVLLMQRGATPSVSDVAEAAEVSRATAYRYFPSQPDLIHAVVDAALGPILSWQSDSTDPAERVSDLLAMSMPRIIEFEATFKAALKLSLEQWAERKAGRTGTDPAFKRGHRVALLQSAIAPLRKVLPRPQFQRLAEALSLVYGIEALIILGDLWGLDAREVEDVTQWSALALVRAAIAEAAAVAKPAPGGRGPGGSQPTNTDMSA
jgi:AcrR family transcriptional regulator